ncbi:hypothetical protein SAY87_017922 [Trapa incisa]|uniref:Pollen Ole e 1 allergen and extensin family protein n=1 Tax=Trapa incisa TaxID=236973 RepID=A0AAN7L377_9MYRT|nr:hypothetical protein SAY87_017922 [Trapa incisa]
MNLIGTSISTEDSHCPGEAAVARLSSSSMAPCYVIAALVVALALVNFPLSASIVVTGKVSCLDCHGLETFNLSGIKVVVKCDKVNKLSTAVTEDDGSFEAELPSPEHSNCLVKVLGGPLQLYAAKTSMVSKITEARDISDHPYFTTSTPLAVSTACPKKESTFTKLGSSKTINLPVPREWGLAPTSYYLPFIPIIGIP